MRAIVRAIATASRCKYEHLKMVLGATQFVTRQLVERALEADGCDPQVDRVAAGSAADAVSRRAIFGD